jgi:hypothetical protein
MFTHTHSNSSTSPSQGSGSNVCQSSTKLAKNVGNPHEGIQRGKPKQRSLTTQPNVTVANQFTVKLKRAPKASKKNTCISFIYHSCRAIQFSTRNLTISSQADPALAHRSTSSRRWTNLSLGRRMVLKTTIFILNQLLDQSIEAIEEPQSKVLHSGVGMTSEVNDIKNMFSSSKSNQIVFKFLLSFWRKFHQIRASIRRSLHHLRRRQHIFGA